ncbi:hypothetical protein GGR02_000736 [Anoxybacillus voinovskiensis]|uniref:Uncharacterized protein n=1 Tax=Anoxybacteroides voinovskiense TaxID=230470 RepID=A0A840DMV2_9BACL|nr:hypothetical protein [Anoxybacillus voinovskiensis]MBB4072975.1 hypothetical protein [Anoxybacillus voinovskiensis]GGJ60406.1 hypothetical protein GCM10008982_06920 [Anoxybacillus voinovskiensis]
MPYIIDEATVVRDGAVKRCSLVIAHNRIDYIDEQTAMYRWVRMPVGEFVMTPGHVMLDFSFSNPRPFSEFKTYMQQHFLAKGCTTLLAVCDVRYEKQLPDALQHLRVHLLNSPVDYFIGVKIPLRTLTPSFVRACKRLRIPVLFIELTGDEPLETLAWGWMYDTFASYPLPLVPYWLTPPTKQAEQQWQYVLAHERIPFLPFALKERVPLALDVLKKIGIYPQKGDIRIGGEVDYNLYAKSNLVAETFTVDYDKHVPLITVHNGKVMKAGDELFFPPGFGRERIVRAPGMFTANFT